MSSSSHEQLLQLANNIKLWGQELGFQKIGISDINLEQHEKFLKSWLDANYHGEMSWMADHGMMRARPQELSPGTVRVISARMNYLPLHAKFAQNLADPTLGYISRYALGRDYHKLVRKRLKKLGDRIKNACENTNFRPFVDSAPILEQALAQKAGLGWIGKHSLLLDKNAGSWFFIGEILINIPLPIDRESQSQCGKCIACKTICPTGAIVEDGVVDARRCISYLTIEYDGVIPVEFRKLIGNRIYGCDDCQLACPYNRDASLTQEQDFQPRKSIWMQPLITLFNWSETEFLENTEGSPIRRIGYLKWRRNIIVALGNAPYDPKIVDLLKRSRHSSQLLDIHIDWAIDQQHSNNNETNQNELISTSTQRLIRSIKKGMSRDA